MYSWHHTEYVGGAHGLAGILYLLLQVLHYKNYVFWKMIHYLLFDFIILNLKNVELAISLLLFAFFLFSFRHEII